MTKTTVAASHRRRMTMAEGEALIEQWRESGLSMQEFCRRHQVGLHRVRYWSRRIIQAPKEQSEQKFFVALPSEGLGRGDDVRCDAFKSDDAIEIFIGECFVRVPHRVGVLAEILRGLQETSS